MVVKPPLPGFGVHGFETPGVGLTDGDGFTDGVGLTDGISVPLPIAVLPMVGLIPPEEFCWPIVGRP